MVRQCQVVRESFIINIINGKRSREIKNAESVHCIGRRRRKKVPRRSRGTLDIKLLSEIDLASLSCVEDYACSEKSCDEDSCCDKCYSVVTGLRRT